MKALRLWSVRHAVGLRRIYEFGLLLVPPMRLVMRGIGRRRLEAVLRPVERVVKEALFDCKMCGQCALSSTGMACPTNCAKNMRNGPCGGVRADGNCEVVPSMRCVWVEAVEGRKRLAGAGMTSPTALAPVDQRSTNSSSWVRVIAGEPPAEALSPERGAASGPAREMHAFEAACRSNRFLVTVEVAPPDSPERAVLLERARVFEGLVDAINVTDGAGGNCHISSVAASTILSTHGFTAIYQVSCRDRNRIAIQSDLLGAAALGLRNVLALTGDDVSNGDHPMAKPVFDLDSVGLLRIARRMRDHGEFASGRTLSPPPNLFLGATTNPFMPPFVDRVANLEAKVDAGAAFIQTQFCFDLELFAEFMAAVRARGLHQRCAIIVGVGILGSAKALQRMSTLVPGVHVPPAVIARVAAAADQRAEGRRFLIETIQSLATLEGVAGVHVMGFKNEAVLAGAIAEAGVRGRPRAAASAGLGRAPAVSDSV